MKTYRITAAALVFALAMAVTSPAWAAGSQVSAEITVLDPPVYSLEISGGSAQYFASVCGDCSMGDDIVVTNTGNRDVYLSMLADTPPTSAGGAVLSFADNATPGIDEIAWAVRVHQYLEGPPVFLSTTAQQISLVAMAIGYTTTFHSNAKTGTAITVPGAYNWTATIIATDVNDPIYN
jgi:hypothetical protein